jgi:hypothetical protein
LIFGSTKKWAASKPLRVVWGQIMGPILSAIVRKRCRLGHLISIGIAVCLAGCIEAQMEANVISYDNTIADTANQSILMNAVRASQHYPMSFTSVGPVIATPPISGSIASTLSLGNTVTPSNTITPTLNASGGYTTFSLDNLNYQSFMEALREPVSLKIVSSFEQDQHWPREMLYLVYVQEVNPSVSLVLSIDKERKRICADRLSEFAKSHCDLIDKDLALFTAAHCGDHFTNIDHRLRDVSRDRGFYYNTATNQCRFLRMRIFLEEMRMLGKRPCPDSVHGPRCVPATFRSALQMIEYLGELIAAQLYINDPYIPCVSLGVSTPVGYEFELVPLFVVQRGVGPTRPSVIVYHNGSFYSIPQPDFGSPTEERSLQVLDLVLQTVRAATHREDLPKQPSLGIVTSSK